MAKRVIILCILMAVLINVRIMAAEQPEFDLTAKSALLMEAETGEIIYAKNQHQQLPPASMTKIMTMLLVMEAIDDGRVNLDDRILVSERAAAMGGSQVYLEAGEEMTLEELMKAIAISSANDASVAVAEYIYGTESSFVREMNRRVTELKLENTYFYNTNGLPPDDPDVEGNYSSAYDLAVISRELLKYPLVLEWTSTWIDYLRGGEFILTNTNKLVRHYNGADGLKTGYTRAAGHCVACTASRSGLRFIAVVMGASESQKRFGEAAGLLSYGFNIFENLLIAEKGKKITEMQIVNGQEEIVDVITPAEISVPIRKGEEENINHELLLFADLKAPLKAGQPAGQLRVYRGNLLIKEFEIVFANDVQKAAIWQLGFRYIKNIYPSMLRIWQK